VTIGVPESFFDAGLNPEVASSIRAALKEYEKLGATLKSVKLDYITCRCLRTTWSRRPRPLEFVALRRRALRPSRERRNS
jgi:Asp-tRNA(Asn)/Glu-tRNA(Gln) amidotransferase A subunit family amidase